MYKPGAQTISNSFKILLGFTPNTLAVKLYLSRLLFLHVLLRLLKCKGWRSRKEGVSGLEAWKRGMAGEERHGHGLEARV